MAYLSLYRKYRPQTFSDVVGQEHVTRTLQNALTSGRVAHGYLFTGTRGTAKTTVARILAKALNCERGPAAEPCNACDACAGVTNGSAIDVIEMDAASHRGVADIEEVRKAVGYGPMELRYKVFIIDEAHQLSSDAKDAFLKTLEEPPDNVVFILATTEPQAIPITIRSRCQQFDFKRGSLHDLARRLKYVLDHENVTYADAAVNLVARGAEGSYRDSLSLLEQVLAYSPTRLTPADVDAVLGTLDATLLARLTDVIARRDAPAAFALAGEMLDAGKEARTLLRTLAAHFRDLLLVSVGGPAVAQELTPDEVTRLQAEARQFAQPQMLRALDVLNEAQAETRHNNQHRLVVELTFLKLMSLGDAGASTGGNGVAASSFATAPIVFPAAPALAPVPSPADGRGVPVAKGLSAPREAPDDLVAGTPLPSAGEGTGVRAAETDTFPSNFFSDDDAAPGDDEDDYVPPSDDELDAGALYVPDAVPAVIAAETAVNQDAFGDAGALVDEQPEPIVDDGPSLFDDEAPAPPATSSATPAPETMAAPVLPPASVPVPETRPAEPAALPETATQPPPPLLDEPAPRPAPVPETSAAFTLDAVFQAWPRFLMEAERISKQTNLMMTNALPTVVSGRQITIAFAQRPNFEMMSLPKKKEFVRQLLAVCLNVSSLQVNFVLDPNAVPAPLASARGKKRPERDIVAAIRDTPPPPAENDGFNGFDSFGASPPPAAAPPRFAPGVVSSAPFSRSSAPPASAANGVPLTPLPSHPALEDPFVQETLSIFGGEIVDE